MAELGTIGPCASEKEFREAYIKRWEAMYGKNAADEAPPEVYDGQLHAEFLIQVSRLLNCKSDDELESYLAASAEDLKELIRQNLPAIYANHKVR